MHGPHGPARGQQVPVVRLPIDAVSWSPPSAQVLDSASENKTCVVADQSVALRRPLDDRELPSAARAQAGCPHIRPGVATWCSTALQAARTKAQLTKKQRIMCAEQQSHLYCGGPCEAMEIILAHASRTNTRSHLRGHSGQHVLIHEPLIDLDFDFLETSELLPMTTSAGSRRSASLIEVDGFQLD